MKTAALTVLSSIFFFFLYAQKPVVSISPNVDIQEDQLFVKIDNGYLSYKTKKKVIGATIFSSINFSKIHFDISLVKYDASMNIIKENDLSSSTIRFNAFEPVIETINNKHYLVYYEAAENNADIGLKIAEIDPNTLSLSPPNELFKIELKSKAWVFKAMDIFNKKKLRIQFSPDKTKTVFLFENGVDNTFTYAVVDKNMSVLWSKANLIDIPEDIVISSACVDNTGNVYTGYKVEKRKTVRGHVLICTAAKVETDLPIAEDINIYHVLLQPSKDGKIIHVAGACFGSTDYLTGVYHTTISTANFKLGEFKKADFEEKFIDSFDQGDLAYTQRNKYGLYRSKMDIYELEDGSIGIIGEISREKERDVSQGSRNYTETDYMYGCILNVCFKNDKVVFSRVPKYRNVSTTWGEGIYAVVNKNDVLVFYNDDEDNLKNSLEERPSKSEKISQFVLVAATISTDGNVKRDILADQTADDFVAFPTDTKKTNQVSVLIPLRRITKGRNLKDDLRLAIVEIK